MQTVFGVLYLAYLTFSGHYSVLKGREMTRSMLEPLVPSDTGS